MDAVSSFSFLIENLPSWREQVTEVSTYAAQKHEEFKAEYNRLVLKAKPKRVKSPSVCSIHTNDETDQKDTASQAAQSQPPPPDPVDISPFEAGNRYIYAQATKKRKPGTSFRSGASGPMKFRNKQMVVIYYDSYVQEKLDSLVKAIGGSRNNLRKGKMSYTLTKGLQLPSLARKYDLSPSIPGLDGVRSTSGYRSSPKLSISKAETTTTEEVPTGEAAFKQVDKELETCQNLCETAAHQFLRDGDCKLELDTVVKNLDRIFDIAKSALETFRTEQKRDELSTESASVSGSTHTESDATLVEKSSREMLDAGQKLLPSFEGAFGTKRPSLPSTNSAPPATTEIEVDDDSDQSSFDIDFSKYRVANRTGMRAHARP